MSVSHYYSNFTNSDIYCSINIERFENNESKMNNRSLNKEMSNLSLRFGKISSIKRKESSFYSNRMISLKKLRNEIKNIRNPYPNEEEIKIVVIKDKNNYTSGKKIKFYRYYEDNKFNKCKKCKNRENKFFCENCLFNICDMCQIRCGKNNHELINLEEKLNEAENIKLEINKIISKSFIEPKNEKLKDNSGIEKKIISNETMDKYEMNNDIDEAPMDYTNDLLLIENIIDKNYINYFHFINIKECYYYMKNKYDKENGEKNKLNLSQKDKEDFMVINYKIDKNKEITKIFGSRFVKNNKDKCKIIIDDIKFELTGYLGYFLFKNHNNKNNNILELKLIGLNNILDASYIFYNCSSLISIKEISKLNINKALNIEYMFYKCSSLISLPNVSHKMISHMSYLFYGCSSLKSLPDISDVNTKYVTDMSYIFYGCSSLTSLSDISKWNTSNVINMSYIFYGCSALDSLPDISK